MYQTFAPVEETHLSPPEPAAAPADAPVAGYGQCSGGCGCMGYGGLGPLCTNCGHAFQQHY